MPPGRYCGTPGGTFDEIPLGAPSCCVWFENTQTSLCAPFRIAPPTMPKPWHATANGVLCLQC
jgi:hypothetical protein